MTISEDYANWQNRLAGVKVPIYEDEPECGFYKFRIEPRSKQYLPAQIWKDEIGEFWASKNGFLANANAIWLYVVKNPITEKEYNELMETYHGE